MTKGRESGVRLEDSDFIAEFRNMDRLKVFNLERKTAIVTGASRGIGEAIARGFAQAGADLVIVSRNLSALERVAREIEAFGGKVLTRLC